MQKEAVIGMLSYSTKGSADSEMTLKMKNAATIVNEKYPELLADGEIQLDVAIEYYQENPDVVIVVTGGQGPQEDITEALAKQNNLIEGVYIKTIDNFSAAEKTKKKIGWQIGKENRKNKIERD